MSSQSSCHGSRDENPSDPSPSVTSSSSLSSSSSSSSSSSPSSSSSLGVTLNPFVKSFVGGVISSTSSCLLLQPLDLLKTRIQAARSPRQPGLAPRSLGLVATTVEVVKNERFFGLWQGLTPSLVRTVPGVGLYFLSLHTIQTYCGWVELSATQGLLAGALARSFAGTVFLPVTVVKTRFESKSYHYKSVAGALRDIYQLEGYRGLYSGLTATLLRDVPFSGLYLAFYSQAKLLSSSASGQMTMPGHFACGVVAGILASCTTQPFDLVKTHMQLNPAKYPSFVLSVRSIVRDFGVTGLFAGMVPRCLRRTLMAALTWMVYEEMKTRWI